jgi:hypothetical protein
MTATRWRRDASGIERRRNTVQARYAIRMQLGNDGREVRGFGEGARCASFVSEIWSTMTVAAGRHCGDYLGAIGKLRARAQCALIPLILRKHFPRGAHICGKSLCLHVRVSMWPNYEAKLSLLG